MASTATQTAPKVLAQQLTIATTSMATSLAQARLSAMATALKSTLAQSLSTMKTSAVSLVIFPPTPTLSQARHTIPRPTPAIGSSPTQTNCCRTPTLTTSQKHSTRQALGQSSCHTQITPTTWTNLMPTAIPSTWLAKSTLGTSISQQIPACTSKTQTATGVHTAKKVSRSSTTQAQKKQVITICLLMTPHPSQITQKALWLTTTTLPSN